MATTSIRTTAKRALVDLIAAGLPTIDVTYGYPAADPTAACVYVVGPHQGTVSFPLMMAGRKARDDDFVLTVWVYEYVAGGTEEEADQACEQLYNAVENVLSNDQSLANLDGVIHATYGPVVLGPNANLMKEGAQALIQVDVTISSRLN